MKNIIIIIIIFLAFICKSTAQLNITTNVMELFEFSKKEKKWLFLEEKQNTCFFEFNKELSYFTLTDITRKYAYKMESFDYEEEEKRILSVVTSDVGNTYLLIIDFKNDNVRFITDETMLRYTINTIWKL
jgi:hypothetical protein